MRILAINGGASGSSWNICKSILEEAKNLGHEVYVATPDLNPGVETIDYYKIGTKFTRFINRFITRIDGSDGFRNCSDTKKLINYIKLIKPDIVHLHTLHGYFINIKLLIEFLRKANIKVVITCHDCWWFTGRCAHFTHQGCNNWKSGCGKCKFKKVYPRTIFSHKEKKYFLIKQKLFSDYRNLTVVCVSNWLSKLCRESLIFKDSKVITVYNGVDQDAFYLGEHKNMTNKAKIISVASQWNESKGLDLIVELCSFFPLYSFIVVGKMKLKRMPKNLINISYLKSKKDLADLYRSCNALLNVSRQETFSLVNIEAQLCGTPVICYAETGMKETISPSSFPINDYNVEAFSNAIKRMLKSDINRNLISKFAQTFSLQQMNQSYLNIYGGDYSE